MACRDFLTEGGLKLTKKLISFLSAGAIAAAVVSYSPDMINASAEDNPGISENAPLIEAGSASAGKGKIVKVNVDIKNNPGITNFLFSLEFDTEIMTLTGYSEKDFSNLLNSYTFDSPYVVSWTNPLANITTSGTAVELTFEIKGDAPDGTYPIKVSYDEDNIYKLGDKPGDTENVYFETINGEITVVSIRKGDVNSDGHVDVTDLTILARSLAKWNGYDAQVNEANADVDGDGEVTVTDYSILARALARWPGYAEKYGIVLG